MKQAVPLPELGVVTRLPHPDTPAGQVNESPYAVAQVIADRQAAGDNDVHYVVFSPQTSPYGEDWHPTVATHEAMANELVGVIREARGW